LEKGKIMEKRPTEMLEEEHHFIQKVVGTMAVLAEALEMGEEVEAETLENIVEFLRTFADKMPPREGGGLPIHHPNEERGAGGRLSSWRTPARA
jgi:hemerythrin-like domain-containing protein